MTKETEESDGRVVPEDGRKPASIAAVERGGKVSTETETAVQLRLPFETADSPQGHDRRRRRGRPSRAMRLGPKSKGVTRSLPLAVRMEEVADKENLKRAFDRVASNKGAPGPDRQSIGEVEAHLEEIIGRLHTELVAGSYQPGAIRRVWIPKPGGGERGLGIPNVIDRIVQQAVHEVLSPWYEASFHSSSHGFRPGKSCHTAIAEAREHVQNGHGWVVDIDLEKFFDKVSHDRLMSKLEERISDARILRLVRRMLKAKVVMPDGVVVSTEEGTPQGGPLSPLLSNIVLDELDSELARRGHRFVRYADDCNVYTRSKRAAERVMVSTVRFIERRLGLKVNAAKSAVARTGERHFLGFRLTVTRKGEVRVGLSERSTLRLKAGILERTPRTWGQTLAACVSALNAYLRGWVAFFGIADAIKGILHHADAHLRRRLRAIVLHQWRSPHTAVRRLIQLGVPEPLAYTMHAGTSWWRKSQHEATRRGLRNSFFEKLGLVSVESLWLERRAKLAVAGYPA